MSPLRLHAWKRVWAAEAPGDVYVADGATATTSYCWMKEGVPEAEVLSFSEWIKTRDIKVSTGNSE